MDYRRHRGNTSAITIVVGHPSRIVRAGLRTLLESNSDITVVGGAENSSKIISMCRNQKPDVILLDIAMPPSDGIQTTRDIMEHFPESKVIVLHAKSYQDRKTDVIHAGASGLLDEQAGTKHLIKAVRQVYLGNAFLSPSVSRVLLNNYQQVYRALETANPSLNGSVLTTREEQIILLIARGYTTKRIAEELFISMKAVDNHRQNIMRKLGIHHVAGLTRYAIREGLITVEGY
ncbi:MAG: response regulator [Fidelibacterota bacterium]